VCLLELVEGFAEPEVVDAKARAELGAMKSGIGASEQVDDLVGERRGAVGRGDELEVGCGAIRSCGEAQVDRRGCRRRAMLEGEAELVVVPSEVSVIVSEGVKVAAPPQGLPEMGAHPLAHVVNDEDGDGVTSLHFAEQAEQ
jgi:hypothetical protein